MEHNPIDHIVQFCTIYEIPYTPPSDIPPVGPEFFALVEQENEWLRQECQQRGITYPWDPDTPGAFDEYATLLKVHWAEQRAAQQRETLHIADELTRPTPLQNRDRQEAARWRTSDDTPRAARYRDRQEARPSQTSDVPRQPSTPAGTPATSPEDASPTHLEIPLSQIQNASQDAEKHTAVCGFLKSSGQPCRRVPLRGQEHCYNHHPLTAALALQTASESGRKSRGSIAAAQIPVELANAGGVAAAISAAVRLFAAGNLSHRQVLSITRLLNLAVRNVRANPRQVDYIFHAEQLESVLEEVEVALQVSEMHERQDEIAGHRQRISAIAEIAAEHGLKPRATPTLPRR